jgi:hypothetical protein
MKIAFHDNGLSVRGTSIALFDYAFYTREYLGHEPLIIFNLNHHSNCIDAYNKFNDQFQVIGYNDKSQIDTILQTNKCEALFMIKTGKIDGVISKVCNNWVNAVGICNINDIHGDKFAFGSKWLSSLTNWQIPYVPHMVTLPNISDDYRHFLNIPNNALVLGRHGGAETFDINFVKKSINCLLKKRSDLYFLFLGTNKFIKHERVIYIEATSNLQTKVKFINTCDAMLHARTVGESFGLAPAEFSIRNKPVITYANSPEKSHLEILGEKAITFTNKYNLRELILNLDKTSINNNEWNMYGDYTPLKVMEKFNSTYIN